MLALLNNSCTVINFVIIPIPLLMNFYKYVYKLTTYCWCSMSFFFLHDCLTNVTLFILLIHNHVTV